MSSPEFHSRPTYYGPSVYCTDVEEWLDSESTDPNGPWRCTACGASDHRELL